MPHAAMNKNRERAGDLHPLTARAGYLLDLLGEGLSDLRVRMAHNGRPPAAHIVNVLQRMEVFNA